ncbi:hypothetical protein CCY99_00570 [Helicobacter sp. 16-1353]|uniref:outer membrane beta-barrel protein n=1 Tax=Helicobacter sp. 16-1353 TaxID=2004996 RepID=UPI000DCDAB69|nr:outer membrane beta-barrel protein [Helicobacter sp. 16-1353]RAX55226.1 hypothetical protein CCY99_00570 [Helicobacter sp. 16-1353]
MKKIILGLLVGGFSHIMANEMIIAESDIYTIRPANNTNRSVIEPSSKIKPSRQSRGIKALQVNKDEKSGIFIGFEMGMDEMQMRDSLLSVIRYKFTGGAVGGKVGYKFFLQPNVGIRAYGSLNYSMHETEAGGGGINITALVFAANADVLYNFYNGEYGIFGAFAGLGLGGSSWDIKFRGYVNSYDTMETTTFKPSGLYMDAKIGLRANISHHGVEFIVKVPFIEAKESFGGLAGILTKQNYQISLGYNFTF